MSASLTLVVLMAIMYGTGVYVMLERSLTRILIGFLLVGNATNLLIFLMSGRAGSAPIVPGGEVAADTVDPLPQVLMLTAIVINFGVTAFILALIYRSWWLSNLGDEGDDVMSDEEKEEAIEAENADELQASLESDDTAVLEVLDEDEDHGDDDGPPATPEPSERERDVMR
ncbi:NADH-quinone oxidoreductase subunit K [Herbiconiux moechotypicola]|uniref:Na(+)/H(+) antiporter subunit C n=1 Tax=Herbiconiux moechotypicola TaxID=637393 RepID=A0ABP5QF00_9MICO|nr:NADH-quinone oxidoreductase subunit K [Herbiconiux moechotypicola]MCS5729932.1 NADH-quinone oxidoreductase subunit K [Herbiconiux moechotypicola]